MKRILIFLPLLAALASCSKESATTPVAGDGIIRVVAGVAATRAVSDASTGLTGASFIVVKGNETTPTSFAGGTAYTGDVAPVNGEVTFTSTSIPTYDLSGENAWFAAFAPGGTLTSNAIEWSIDGHTDIMVTNNVWDAGTYRNPTWIGLNFNHRLSQVEVVCQAESGASLTAVQATWGDITRIEFMEAPTTMKYDLNATPTVTVSGSANLPLLADYDGAAFVPMAIPASGNTSVNAMAMLAPVTPTATESFRLSVTTSGDSNPITVEIPVKLDGSAAAMTAGRKHKVTLTFKAEPRQIDVVATDIEAWSEGDDANGDMEIPLPLAVGDYYYSDGTRSKRLKAGKTVEGIVFWIDPADSTHYKVAALEEEGKAWSTDLFLVGTGEYAGIRDGTGQCTAPAWQSGKTNREILERWIADDAVNTTNKTIADFPAFKYCDDMGEGWYLPATNELQYLSCAYNAVAPQNWGIFDSQPFTANVSAQAAFNARLTAVDGGAAISADFYGSATESAGNYAYDVRLGQPSTTTMKKTVNTEKVRCIREVN